MLKKVVVYSIFAIALLGSQTGRAQNPDDDQVYIGSTGVANPLEYSGSAPVGKVTATCVQNNTPLGGYYGAVTESTTKGNQGGGLCPSDYIVTGSVQAGGSGPADCEPKVVTRPKSGWNRTIHYAHFGSVIVANNKIVCSMGGE